MARTAPFWRELGRAFESAGHRVIKVHFAMGEFVHWRRLGGIHYRGSLTKWPDFLRRLVAREGITDIVYYAIASPITWSRGRWRKGWDRQLRHREWLSAPGLADALERGGMGAYSHLPTDPETYRRLAADLPRRNLVTRYPTASGRRS